MLKGGITYCNRLTTVSNTYAGEIQTEEYGEGLAEHLRYHQNKIRGIVNGIDINIWNPSTDKLLKANYDAKTAIENKKKNKKALQESLGLEVDEHKMVIGLISRLTNQKGLIHGMKKLSVLTRINIKEVFVPILLTMKMLPTISILDVMHF